MDARRIVGRNVRRLREQKRWSQEELAARSGIHRTYISGVERGVRNPTVTIVQILGDTLGISASDLLREDA